MVGTPIDFAPVHTPNLEGDRQALSGRESIRMWLATFGELESTDQRRQLISLLAAFRSAPQYTHQSLEAFTELTETWYDIAETLSRRFRHNPTAVASDPEQFHSEMAELSLAFAQSYAGFLESFTASARAWDLPDQRLPKITALALFYFGKSAKSLYCKNELPDDQFWQGVHFLYSFASENGFVADRIGLLGGNEVMTTCNQLWLRLVILATLSSGNLTARQLDRTDEWLGDWCTRITVDTVYDPTLHVYCVDIGAAQGPRRITPDMKMERPLYLGTRYLYPDIAAARTRIVEDSMTSSIGWYAENPLKEYFELLDRLQRLWMFTPSLESRRASERSPADAGEEVEVVRGFAEILVLLEGAAAGAPHIGTYAIIDQSATGFGLFAPSDDRRPLDHFELVAVRSKGGDWLIGMVVRTTTLPSHKGRVIGVHFLARTAILVSLQRVGDGSGLAPEAAPDESAKSQVIDRAFYLVGNDAKNQADSLLAPISTYIPGEQLKIKTATQAFVIRINRVIESGDSWQRIGFQVLKKVAPT